MQGLGERRVVICGVWQCWRLRARGQGRDHYAEERACEQVEKTGGEHRVGGLCCFPKLSGRRDLVRSSRLWRGNGRRRQSREHVGNPLALSGKLWSGGGRGDERLTAGGSVAMIETGIGLLTENINVVLGNEERVAFRKRKAQRLLTIRLRKRQALLSGVSVEVERSAGL